MANKQRLVDANDMLAGICKDCGNGCDLENNYCLLATEIMKAPTVDAVEVVRCKDCKHYMLWEDSDDEKTCAKSIGLMVSAPDDFCSYGERRTNV